MAGAAARGRRKQRRRRSRVAAARRQTRTANGEHAMIGKIISGGQTGVDQAALRAAKACGIPTGGWAPKWWKTEDGPASWLADFALREHASADYAVRTRANVADAGLTLILVARESDLARGTALTFAGRSVEQGQWDRSLRFDDVVPGSGRALPRRAQVVRRRRREGCQRRRPAGIGVTRNRRTGGEVFEGSVSADRVGSDKRPAAGPLREPRQCGTRLLGSGDGTKRKNAAGALFARFQSMAARRPQEGIRRLGPVPAVEAEQTERDDASGVRLLTRPPEVAKEMSRKRRGGPPVTLRQPGAE